MSGARSPLGRGWLQPFRLPRLLPGGNTLQTVNTAFDLIEQADATNAKVGRQVMFQGVVLIAPGGQGFWVRVDDNGQLRTEPMPPGRQF